MKKCTKCGKEKPLTEFSKDKSKKDGYGSICKRCKNKQKKLYYQENKEKISERQKLYRQENKEKIKHYRQENKEKTSERNKLYYQENKEKISERQKLYRQENKEKISERQKLYRQENKETISEWEKLYRQENKEKVNMWSNQHYQKNKEAICERRKLYRQENKELFREQWKRNYQKNKINHNMSAAIRQSLKKRNLSKNNSSWIKLVDYTIEELKQHLEKQFEPWMNWDNHGVYEKDKQKWHIDHIKPQSLFEIKEAGDEEFKKCWALENLRPLEAIENMSKGAKLLEDLGTI